jgi:predicted hydrocarbon binding protein
MRALVPVSTPGRVHVPFAATAPPPRAVQMRLDVKRAFKLARPTLGSPPGMALFRLLRLAAFEDVTGRDDQGSGYLAGKKLGRALEPKSLDDFLALAQTLKLGLIRIPRLDDDGVHLDLYECASCTGLEKIGCPICHFEAGLFAGVLEAVTGRPVEGREITCIGGLGDDACGFELDFR